MKVNVSIKIPFSPTETKEKIMECVHNLIGETPEYQERIIDDYNLLVFDNIDIKSIEVTIRSVLWKIFGSAENMPLFARVNWRLNLDSISSSCHCFVRPPGVMMRILPSRPLIINSFMTSPVIMVFPAPVSSARRKRIFGSGSRNLYTAST